MLLALLPALAFSAGGIQTDASGQHFLYSAKLQKKLYLGLKPHAKKTASIDKSFLDADVKVPNDFVMTDKWPFPVGLPFDQGQCGSCVYNSITGNYTYSLSIRGLLPSDSSPLSRAQLMNCIPNAGQCSGDYAENVGSGLVGLKGLVPESAYTYREQDGSCRSVSAQKIGPIVGGHVIDSSPKSIGTAMVMGVPVSTTVGADGTWMNAGAGVYKNCTNQGTNHEVLIYGIHCNGSAHGGDGFCDFANAKNGDVVIDILNSWGSQWADKGTIHTVITSSNGTLCNNVTEEVYVLDTGVPVSKPVDGGLSDWGTCVGGTQSRTCTNPSPAFGGKGCNGSLTQVCTVPVPPGPISGNHLMLWLALGAVLAAIIGGFIVGRRTKPIVLSQR